jgi:hypothetical protein
MSAYALPGLFPPLELESNVGISTDDVHYLGSLDKEEKCEYEPRPVPPEVDIAVTEAKIDAVQLIRSLTSTVKRRAIRRLDMVRPRKGYRLTDLISRQWSSSSTPQEHAMEFELSISFNGRRYTVVRSLPRIRQLRQDLVEELERSSFDDCREDFKECLDCTCNVPELPSVLEQEDFTACSQSFTLLHAMIRAFTPTLESWLRCVVSLIPPKDSPILTSFLLEPLCLVHDAPYLDRRPTRGRSTPGKLEAIEELDEVLCDE